ncbi:uncharacterized protein GGS25DRAFT_467243 [Hypoxylon fragiforme]|uniref:uncharacterized protein n=1 Tax=Hypoxylon fragiforme TaxID=63214 RepID=UPI0020C68BED|nr:uncharacterized protein GGS25DRAFT_467243 [Hypoxylon fragiforme]KAI2613459.1 hypothetical protein GGS25DRAFT_467243 [Hypoxylon fragiforme]
MVSYHEREEHYGLLADDGAAGGLDEKAQSQVTTSPSTWKTHKVPIVIFSISIITNILLIFGIIHLTVRTDPSSRYANLRRTREEPYVLVTQYSSDNDTLQDQLWHNINVDSAVVALSDEWAARHDLRTAQRFPWDQTKGIYILHGYHNLHCLKIIYISLSEYKRGAPQTRSWHHISHCLDALRRQILCDADDTPRATDRRAEVVSGLLQHRKCRRWEDLEDFARRHTGCYKRPENPETDSESMIERFKHCPPGSGYVIADNYVPSDKFLIGLPAESLDDH